MAISTTSALLIGLGAAGGYAASRVGSRSEMPSAPSPLPKAPAVEDSQAKAEEATRKRRVASTQSIYTNPLGIVGQANVIRKTLTGQ